MKKWLKKNRETAPIYGVGLTWLLYALITRDLSGGKQILLCAGLSVLVAVVLAIALREPKKKEKPAESAPGKEEAKDPLLSQGREYVQKIQSLRQNIQDVEITAMLQQMCLLTEKILTVVDKQPEKKPKIRQTIGYYLPTVEKLLGQYLNLQDQLSPGENIKQGMERIKGILDDVIVALQKQLDSMFEADLMDITAEVRVMEKKLAGDGLADDTML